MNKAAVLIVDDVEADRYILKRQLKQTGLIEMFFEAENGQDALELFNNYEENSQKYPGQFPPLAIFLDINMPLVNGFEFLEQYGPIRERHGIETSFIMMFSSSASEEDRSKAFSYGYVKGYITKGSYSSDQLREELGNLLK